MKTAPQSQTSRQAETRLIPLNLLRVDSRNVRSPSGDPARVQADSELVSSIRSHGLLENLVVVPRGTTQFGVAAGARRLRALKTLAADSQIPKDHPVPCLVIDKDAATESSLAENAVRVAMHPADQVAAFSKLAADGATTEQIAARFGVAERTVQKRVRLGGLADEILGAYREGRINADTAEAFATTADVDFQRNTFKSLSDSGQLHGHSVRHAIGQRRTRSDAAPALYVGLTAYREAGGAVEDPLFEDDYVSILDPDLMERLADQKLTAVAERYAAAWKWTSSKTEFTWMDQQEYLIADPDTRADFTEDETAALAAAEQRIEEASVELDSHDATYERRRQLWDVINGAQAAYDKIETDRADRDVYSDTVREHAGVLVSIDCEGNLDIHHGLVRRDDADAYRAARSSAPASGTTRAEGSAPAEAAPGQKKNGGYSEALRNDFRVMRTAALRRALARNAAVATDLVGFILARMVGFGRSVGYEAPVLAIRQEYQGNYASDAMKATDTMNHLEPAPDVDMAWLATQEPAAAFRAYRSLSDDDRGSVLAHAVAALTVPRLTNDSDASPVLEQAIADLDIDLPAELEAVGALPFDQDLVWKRMTKSLILDAGAVVHGSDWALNRARLSKKELVASAAGAFRSNPTRKPAKNRAATRWLPPGFAPNIDPADTAPDPEAPDETMPEAAEDAADNGARSPELPAFLTKD